ncbi:MAG: UTP--glucose-1-phosphate uridylyltransferase [Clostridiales bacterium]|nr:MAG: UTP--glucose-1-phosphate uridylyltransferase [Clostridiales bacterium]
MKVKKAIIPAAGLGTRFLPYTKAMPKEMLNIVDKPAIQYNVEELVDSGIEDILIISARNKDSIINHFDITPELDNNLKIKGQDELLKISEHASNLAHIHFIRQGFAKGLGHAVYMARHFIGNEPFVVLLGDDIIHYEGISPIKKMYKIYEKTGSSVIGTIDIPMEKTNLYGIIESKNINGLEEIVGIVEKPDPKEAKSNRAVIGRYLLTPEIFECIENVDSGYGGEIQLTDAIALLLESQKVYSHKITGDRYDVGNKNGYLKATVEYALRDKKLSKHFKEYLKNLDIDNFK